jgi:hypothetical protein
MWNYTLRIYNFISQQSYCLSNSTGLKLKLSEPRFQILMAASVCKAEKAVWFVRVTNITN